MAFKMREYEQFFKNGAPEDANLRTVEDLKPAIIVSSGRQILNDTDLDQLIESIGDIRDVVPSKNAFHFAKKSNNGNLIGVTFEPESFLVSGIDTIYMYADATVKDGTGTQWPVIDLNSLYTSNQIITYTDGHR